MEQAAIVIVSDRQLSLAIGREGQNARLAAKLTNWKIDIKSSTEIEIERMKVQIEGEVAEREAATAAVAEAPPEVASADEADLEPAEVPAAAEIEPAAAVVAPEEEADEAAIMAELEAEVAAEVVAPPVGGPAGALSPEEMLALESLDAASLEEEEVIIEEEIDGEGIISEDVWKMPERVGGGPTIRFAEDILGAPSGARRAGGRRRGGAGGNRQNQNRNRPPRPGGPGGPARPPGP